jgi:hypothetical protein
MSFLAFLTFLTFLAFLAFLPSVAMLNRATAQACDHSMQDASDFFDLIL